MPVVNSLAAAVAFLGRHGTIAVALSIFAGLLVPGLAGLLKPWLGETVFALLVLSFLRVEPAALRARVRRPALVIAAAVWVMLAIPVMLAGLFLALGLNSAMPGLYLILILQASAPALMSSPALAALMGLDVALTLAGLLLCTAVTPFTAGSFTHFFLGTALIEPLGFGVRLFLIITGSALVAAVVRRLAGNTRVETQREVIDGLSVLGMFVFAAAAMDGVAAHALRDPALVAGLTALAFAIALALIGLTAMLFLPAGRQDALSLGLLAGNRNMGLMLAAAGFAVPDVAWLYFGLAQFPIYLLPALLKPLVQRLTAKR